MGFGHRVYKNYDPRAKVMKNLAQELLDSGVVESKLLNLALKLEKAALSDPYFIQRKLFPNVDFYTGIIYEAIGIPLDMFTVMFAIGRTSGWVFQWREMMLENSRKIGRPRQLYVGEKLREFENIEDRGILAFISAVPEEKDYPTFLKHRGFAKLPIL